MPKVSLIIPIYEDEVFIKDLIETIENQTFKDFECLFYVHGSTDNSYSLLNIFAKRDERVRIIKVAKNIGSGAVNQLLKYTKGEYIKFFCADDIMMPDCLKKQVLFFDQDVERKYQILFGRVTLIDSLGRPIGDCVDKHHAEAEILNRDRYQHLNYMFYKGNYQFSYPTMMIRSSILKNYDFLDERFAQINDTLCWINMLLDGNEAYILNDLLVKYRMHNQNVSNLNDPGNKARFIFEFQRLLEPYIQKIKSFDELLKIFPEAREFTDKLEDDDVDLIPFIICQLALRVKKRVFPFLEFHKNFAISKIFDILGNRDLALKIYDKFDFHYCDLKNITLKNPNGVELSHFFNQMDVDYTKLNKKRGLLGIPYRIKKKIMKRKIKKLKLNNAKS